MGSFICRMPVVALIVWLACAPAAPLQADEADDQYAVAAAHYDRQQWKLAAEEFEAFLQKFPATAEPPIASIFTARPCCSWANWTMPGCNFANISAAIRKASTPARRCSGWRGGLSGRPFRLGQAGPGAILGQVSRRSAWRLCVAVLGRHRPWQRRRRGGGRILSRRLKSLSPTAGFRTIAAWGWAGRWRSRTRRTRPSGCIWPWPASRTVRWPTPPNSISAPCNTPPADTIRRVESFAAFDNRLANSPWQPNARLGHGLALLKLNRPAEATKQFDAVLANTSAGDELFQQAARGKVQAALQTKDYAAVDRQAAQFEKRFPGARQADDVRRMLARSLVERKEYARAVAPANR